MNRTAGFILAFVWVLTGALHVMAIEEANYKVIRKTNPFEIRDYAPHIVAETVVEGSLEEAGSISFKTLFGYISGNNRSRQKVEMTAPVSQQANREQIKMTAPVGDPTWARYNPPFTPWFLRRNEILIPVAPDESQDTDQANIDTIKNIVMNDAS